MHLPHHATRNDACGRCAWPRLSHMCCETLHSATTGRRQHAVTFQQWLCAGMKTPYLLLPSDYLLVIPSSSCRARMVSARFRMGRRCRRPMGSFSTSGTTLMATKTGPLLTEDVADVTAEGFEIVELIGGGIAGRFGDASVVNVLGVRHRLPAGGGITPIIEQEVVKVARLLAGNRRQHAHVHQQGAFRVKQHHLLVWQPQGNTQGGGGRLPHGPAHGQIADPGLGARGRDRRALGFIARGAPHRVAPLASARASSWPRQPQPTIRTRATLQRLTSAARQRSASACRRDRYSSSVSSASPRARRR